MATPQTSLIRQIRNWFFETPEGTSYDRLSKQNRPTTTTFRTLLNSVLFAREVADTAKETEAGHVKTATDANVEARTSSAAGEHTTVVLPHQLPCLEVNDGTEAITKDTAVTDEGISITAKEKTVAGTKRLNFRIKALLGGSLKINTKNIELDGDEVTPDNDKFYGRSGNAKGWFITMPTWLWAGGTQKALVSNGLTRSWVATSTFAGTGGSGYAPDNQSLKLTAETTPRLMAKLQAVGVSLPGPDWSTGKAPCIKYDANGIYLNVDPEAFSYNAAGQLILKSGGGSLPDSIDRVDDFESGEVPTVFTKDNVVANTTDLNGVVVLDTTASEDSAYLGYTVPAFGCAQNVIAKARVKCTLGASAASIKVGLMDNAADASILDGVYFYNNAGSWYCGAIKAGVDDVDYDAGALVDSVYVNLKIVAMDDGSALCYIENVLIHEFAAGALDTTKDLYFQILAVDPSGSATRTYVYVDYMAYTKNRYIDSVLP